MTVVRYWYTRCLPLDNVHGLRLMQQLLDGSEVDTAEKVLALLSRDVQRNQAGTTDSPLINACHILFLGVTEILHCLLNLLNRKGEPLPLLAGERAEGTQIGLPQF